MWIVKTLWTLGLILMLAGCRPAAKPPAAPVEDEASVHATDVLTQRPVLDAGQKAATTVRQAAEQENQQLQEVQMP